MANTYSQIHIQIVFAIKNRYSLIKATEREKVEKYICGIILNNKCKPLAIYCNPDHIHILIGLHPAMSVSELVRKIKSASCRFIHTEMGNNTFYWQDGFGVFSYSKTQIKSVIQYIINQPEHHKKRSFKNEYIDILQKTGINYDAKYLFDWLE